MDKKYEAVGTIKGTVEAMTRRKGIRFVVYDSIFDRPINCYLESGHEGDVKDYWGSKVFVSGLISRDSETGKPFAIRRISQIKPVDSSPPGSYRDAMGVLMLDEPSEDFIRKLRDE